MVSFLWKNYKDQRSYTDKEESENTRDMKKRQRGMIDRRSSDACTILKQKRQFSSTVAYLYYSLRRSAPAVCLFKLCPEKKKNKKNKKNVQKYTEKPWIL